MSKVIGIDLGTTYSAAAFLDGGIPMIIPNAEGGRLTPSVVAFPNNGSVLVGQLAKRQAVANPNRTVASIKRRMGSEFKVNIDSKLYTPQEISGLILRKIKGDAEAYLGGTIEKAVITVPAYFNDRQRQATKDAGSIAGLDVIRVINEPTAASLAYGLDKEDIHTILVWDLGGGTFDVSLLELGQGVFEVKAVNGNTQLGGDDFDQRIIDHVAEEFIEKSGMDLRTNRVALQRLREASEKAKIEFSDRPEAWIRLPFVDMGQGRIDNLETTITREKFDELTKDLVEMMIGPTRQVLHDAQLEPNYIDRVILVGGATRMVCVQNLVRDLLGKEPYREINPDEVVALGAAIQAGILTGEMKELVLVDVTPLSLGIEVQGGIFARIIDRNTAIPTSSGQIFTTAVDAQTEVDIHVLQGERGMADYNVSLGRFQVTDIPPLPKGEPKIEVEFNIDSNGIVNVSAKDLHTGNRADIVIATHGGLSKEEIEKMVQEAQAHADEDMQEKDTVEIRIQADNMICAAEKAIENVDQKAPRTQLDAIEKGILDLKMSLADDDKGEIELRIQELQRQIGALYG